MKKLTIQDISHPKLQNEPIWVLNNTEHPSRGPVIFVIEKPGTNERTSIIIPDTWLPQNLIEYVPREHLLGSTHFRQVIQSESIIIIEAEEASKLLSEEGAEEEQQRLKKVARGDSLDVPEIEEDNSIPAYIQQFIGDIEGNTKTDTDLINILRRHNKIEQSHLKLLFSKAKANDRPTLAKFIKAKAKK